MSLTPQFFISREHEIETRGQRGEVELENFLKKHGLETSALIDCGLLDEKGIQSTGDILSYHLTDAGKPFLIEMHRLQLLFIKKGKAQELLNILHKRA